MDRLDAALTGGLDAQRAVIGAMIMDENCVPLVLSQLGPDDFVDGKCRATFLAIRRLKQEGGPIDQVTVAHALQGGDKYASWLGELMYDTLTAAKVEAYIPIVREQAKLYRFRALCDQGKDCLDIEEAEALARKIGLSTSGTDRMPMMTAEERVADFHQRMKARDKPKYLPWGIPTVDRALYAELGDMILLGGYASSGKTLLSITMAMAQARAGYKVGYYSLETSPQKITDRQISTLSKVPLAKIKTLDFTEADWAQIAPAEAFAASEGGFPVIDAARYTVDDITAHAIGYQFQVIYVDYVQRLRVAGMRSDNPRIVVSEVSQRLKDFARSTKTAVVALAQLTRPEEETVGSGAQKKKVFVPPSMHSFKESGQLEQDADAAFLIWPSDMNDNTSNRILKVGKNKEGRRPKVELVFHGDIQTMVELEPEPDYSVAKEMAAKGRAVQAANRYKSRQVEFQELRAGDKDNPFV